MRFDPYKHRAAQTYEEACRLQRERLFNARWSLAVAPELVDEALAQLTLIGPDAGRELVYG